MAGALPPSSSDRRLSVPAASAAILLPVAEEPVKLMTSMCGDWLMARPMSAPDSVNEQTTPEGKPAMEVKHSNVSWFTRAVWCAALITTVQPAASAGASDRATRQKQKRPKAKSAMELLKNDFISELKGAGQVVKVTSPEFWTQFHAAWQGLSDVRRQHYQEEVAADKGLAKRKNHPNIEVPSPSSVAMTPG
jgi:hypothetical protein